MIINEKKGENRTPVYMALLHGQPLDPVFSRYAAEQMLMKPAWKPGGDDVRIYEDNTGHFCLAKVSENGKSRDSMYNIHVYRAGNPCGIAKALFTKPGKHNGVVFARLHVDAEENNKGIAGLLMSHAMDIITKTLGVNKISLCAHPGFLNDIKKNCTADEIQKHKEDLMRFYEQYGVRETDGGLPNAPTMEFDPKIGYRRPLEYNIGECHVCSASYAKKNAPLAMNLLSK